MKSNICSECDKYISDDSRIDDCEYCNRPVCDDCYDTHVDDCDSDEDED